MSVLKSIDLSANAETVNKLHDLIKLSKLSTVVLKSVASKEHCNTHWYSLFSLEINNIAVDGDCMGHQKR